jgi:N utilization substance protein B
VRRRTRARELALQFLYTLDVRGREALDELDEFLRNSKASQEAMEFVRDVVEGVLRHQQEIDARIREIATNWKLERIATVDRNVLRIATYELLYKEDVPPRVAINEAIELGKRYSTAQTGAFLNGILDRMQQFRGNRNTA